MPSFSAVVTCHSRSDHLRKLLGNLLYQTRKADEILVFVSGLDAQSLSDLRDDFNHHASFIECDDLQDWGHDKRAKGLGTATSDFVGFFNDDDSYTLDYIERMMEAVERDHADAAYCDWNRMPGCNFSQGSSTSGNFIVRTKLASEIGYLNRHYEADGSFINAICTAGALIVKVPHVLYFHNSQ